jgi:hypothetical protein
MLAKGRRLQSDQTFDSKRKLNLAKQQQQQQAVQLEGAQRDDCITEQAC